MRIIETWHCFARTWVPEENLGETIGEGSASSVVETPGLKRSWRGDEDWHCVAGSESPKRTQERLLVRCSQMAGKTPTFWRCQMMWLRISAAKKWGWLEPQGAHCLICGKPVGAQKIMSESQKSDSEPYMIGLWFCIVIVPWFFPLGVRKDLTYFLFYRSPQLRGAGILERLNSYSVWISKDWDFSKLECFKLLY